MPAGVVVIALLHAAEKQQQRRKNQENAEIAASPVFASTPIRH